MGVEGIANDDNSRQLKPPESAHSVFRSEGPQPPVTVGDLPELPINFLQDKGVEEMLKTYGGTKLPSYYVQPEHLRHGLKLPTEAERKAAEFSADDKIPVVDLASSHEDLVAAIRAACQWGFFHVVNHGTPKNLLRRFASQAEEFFALPVEEKMRCTTEKKVAGAIHFGGGSKGDWRDVLKVICAPPSAVRMDRWPRLPEGFRETMVDYCTQQRSLVMRLLEVISESLGLESEYIKEECNDPRILLAINRYPPCPDPTVTLGIREHSDPCTITVLLEDQVGGLQVLKDGEWIDVKPLKDGLVVNMGDHMQILTNGKYCSCLHRVINSNSRTRTSTALFFSPSMTAQIKPASLLIDEEHPALYREFEYGEFLKKFYQGGGPNKKTILGGFQKLQ